MPFLDKNKLILDVSLDALSFVAGTEFSGTATLVVLETTNLRGLVLTYAVTRKCDGALYGANQSVVYSQEVGLMGDRVRGTEATSYKPGIQQFPFRVSIPAGVPPTMTTHQDQVHHVLYLEAVIPYSLHDRKERFELHVMRGVSPMQYQLQSHATVAQQGVLGYSCINVPCCYPWVGGPNGDTNCCGASRSCLAIDAVNDWTLLVHRPVISLLNDRTVPVRVSGRITSRCQVALVRDVGIKGSRETDRTIGGRIVREVESWTMRSRKVIVGQFILPRTPAHITHPVMDIHIPLDFDAIEDIASFTPGLAYPTEADHPPRIEEAGLTVSYYVTLFVLYDEGCLANIDRSLSKKVPVTVVHCIHENAPALVSRRLPLRDIESSTVDPIGGATSVIGESAMTQEMTEIQPAPGSGVMLATGLAPPPAPGPMGSAPSSAVSVGGRPVPFSSEHSEGESSANSRVAGTGGWITGGGSMPSTSAGGNAAIPSWMQDIETLDSHLDRLPRQYPPSKETQMTRCEDEFGVAAPHHTSAVYGQSAAAYHNTRTAGGGGSGDTLGYLPSEGNPNPNTPMRPPPAAAPPLCDEDVEFVAEAGVSPRVLPGLSPLLAPPTTSDESESSRKEQ